jgi:hypothetical protein
MAIKEMGVINVSLQERRNFQYEVETSAYSISDVVTSSRREKLTDYQIKIIENSDYPVKARKLVASLFRKGITGKYVKNLLSSGVNPFLNTKPVILDVICRLILERSLTVKSLRDNFTRSGQGNKTALSQTHTVIHAFVILGVLDKSLQLRG